MIELIFERNSFCGIKCSLPKDYNDPFELFLGVDANVSTECLATYREFIDEVPQLPTTCFSKSPIVPPMWAHYGQNQSGFVLEFDVQALENHFEEIQIREIDYRDTPDPSLQDHLERATATRKPRHAVWLTQAVMSSSYFSKYTDWSYEQECRIVAPTNCTENISGNEILFIPNSCLTSIITGQKIPAEKAEIASKIAAANKLDLYKLKIGRSFSRPFMSNTIGESYVFENGALSLADNTCGDCAEPIQSKSTKCGWCSITEAHEQQAARGNMFRAMERLGTLDSYMEGVKDIQKRRRE